MPSPLSFPPDGQPIHFLEAIRAAEARNVVLPDVYYGQLQGVARQKAFSIAGIASYDQLKAVLDDLNKAQANGQTFKQWKRNQSVKDLKLPMYRLDNLFRTNIQGQYMAGRWEQIIRTQDARPYLMYDAINDSRTRPAHKALDGFIRPVNDPIWRRISPLNGYRCRCGLISLTEAQAKARSVDGKGLNKAYDTETMQPDKGWEYSPQDRLDGINKAVADRQGGGVLSSALNQRLAQDMKIVDLDGFAAVQAKMADIAKQRPEWFPLGFNGIHAVGNAELFAGFDRQMGLFYLSVADELVSGFSPAKELQGALNKIAISEPLTFNNEYAVECLWHEMVHGITGIAPDRYPINGEPIAEGVVQWLARHSYPALMEALGGKAAHYNAVIKGGLAYPQVTSNLIALLDKAALDHGQLSNEILKEAGDWKVFLSAVLAEKMAIKPKDINALLNYAERLSGHDFAAKLTVKLTNARRSKDAP